MIPYEFFWHANGEFSSTAQLWVERGFELALEHCLEQWPESGLAELSELELSVVSDEVLAQLHGNYCNDPSPTDVITFPHGEILVSVEMAERKGPEFGKEAAGELLLYLIHGLLHLVGYDDRESGDREKMHRVQELVWSQVVAKLEES